MLVLEIHLRRQVECIVSSGVSVVAGVTTLATSSINAPSTLSTSRLVACSCSVRLDTSKLCSAQGSRAKLHSRVALERGRGGGRVLGRALPPESIRIVERKGKMVAAETSKPSLALGGPFRLTHVTCLRVLILMALILLALVARSLD